MGVLKHHILDGTFPFCGLLWHLWLSPIPAYRQRGIINPNTSHEYWADYIWVTINIHWRLLERDFDYALRPTFRERVEKEF